MKNEYGVDIMIQKLPFSYARWIAPDKITKDILGYTGSVEVVEDKYNRPVLLFRDHWALQHTMDKNKGVQLVEIPTSI